MTSFDTFYNFCRVENLSENQAECNPICNIV